MRDTFYRSEMRPLVTYLLLAFLLAMGMPCALAQTEITSNQTVTGTVAPGGNLYSLSDGVDPSVLVEITFTIDDDSSADGDHVYLTVTDQDYNYLGQVDGRTDDIDYISTICPSSNEAATSYIFSVQGTPGAGFTLRAQLIDAEVRTGQTIYDQTLDGPAYFFFNVDRTDAPLEITVNSDDDEVEAVLQGTYQQCPPFDETSRTLLTEPNVKTAWLTFTEKGRLSLSEVDPELQTGRWYFAIYGRSQTRNKQYRMTIEYGLEYDQYYAPELVLLFIYPIIMLMLIAFPFILAVCMNKTPWLKKTDPRAGYEDDEIIVPTKSNYLPFTIICGVFFFIPALQVAARAANDARDEGDRDECYYNDLCAKPTNIFAASNNIWSNVGYMWSGVIMLIYFFVCKEVLRLKYLISRDPYVVYGISVSIILVGMLSLTYHICPTREMFQFDTAFMFVTSGLLLTEIFRKYFHKHPRVWIPFALFALLFIINFLGSIVDITGTYEGKSEGISNSDRKTKRYIYRACLTAFMICVFCFVFYFVYLKPKRKWGEQKKSKWRDQEGAWNKLYHKYLRPIGKRLLRIRVFHPLRLITIIIWAIVMIIIIWARPDSDLSQTLLYIMVVSFLWFLFAYLVHKFRIICAYICCRRQTARKRAEHSWLAAILWLYLGIGTLATWIVALIFFSVLDSSDKSATPAESRADNSDCLVWDFYDSHDLWHVLSAVGLMLGALFVFHTDVMEGPLPKTDKGSKKHADP